MVFSIGFKSGWSRGVRRVFFNDLEFVFVKGLFSSGNSFFKDFFVGKRWRYVKNVFNPISSGCFSFNGSSFVVDVLSVKYTYEVTFKQGRGWSCTCEFYSAWKGVGEALCWHVLRAMVVYEVLYLLNFIKDEMGLIT